MLQTDQGEFPSLAALRGAFIRAHNGCPDVAHYFNTDEWDDSTLHISELGKCLRQQMYRLLGTEKNPVSQRKQDNKELLFWQAHMIHALTCGALDWSGILISYEHSLPGLPEGWSGHFDAVFLDREAGMNLLWDGKTVMPTAFDYSYDWPKPEVVAQIRGYLRFTHYLADAGLVEYIDRGGSNTPQLFPVTADDVWVKERMAATDYWYSGLPELPPPLTREYTITYRKVRNEPRREIANVWLAPSWQCDYCDYCRPGCCEPETEKLLVAEYKRVHGENTRFILDEGHAENLEDFLEDAVKTIAIEEPVE
jgi:hypothetical protein